MPLLVQAIRKRSAVCLDLALDLMVLPLSYVVANLALLMVATAICSFWLPHLQSMLWLGAACIIALSLHILRGWQLSGMGLQGLLDLGRAPGFLVWKLLLMLRRRESSEWVRTEREKT